jgi:3-oxoacyl-(acyl-carrier-protein) synthase
MKRRRVKITGIGPVTPAGIGKDEFWKGILEPVSRVRPYEGLGAEYGPFVAAYIERFNIAKYVDRVVLPKGAARHTLFAVAGAVLAVQDAGISREELCGINCAVVTGSSIMDFGGTIRSIDAVRDRGMKMAQSRVLYAIGIGSVPSAINQAIGTNARTVALSNQCSSGLDAIGYAAALVASGEIDLAICGGTEAPLHRFPLIELRAADLTPATEEMPGRQARPFDLWRTTGVVGEGSCMFVIEAEDSVRPGYSYVTGYGFANDEGNDLCGGMVAAGKLAMAQAHVRAPDIEILNAWGPGHKMIDKAEVRAMRQLLGSHLPNVAAVSIKGAIGTPLGAAPAIQLAAAALAQRLGRVPPTVNWDFPDPDCDLNLSNRARDVAHRYTLVNSHGLGSVNSSMILERCR